MHQSPLDELEFKVENHRIIEANLPKEKIIFLSKRILRFLHKTEKPEYVGRFALELNLSIERVEAIVGILIDSGYIEFVKSSSAKLIGGRDSDSIIMLSQKSSPNIANCFL